MASGGSPHAALKVAEVAEIIRRGAGFVRRNAERLGGRKAGRDWLFTEDGVQAWLRAGQPTTDRAMIRKLEEYEINLGELQNAFGALTRRVSDLELKTQNSKLKTAA